MENRSLLYTLIHFYKMNYILQGTHTYRPIDFRSFLSLPLLSQVQVRVTPLFFSNACVTGDMIRRTRPLRPLTAAVLLGSVVSIGFIMGVLIDTVEVSLLRDITDENLVRIRHATPEDPNSIVQHSESILRPSDIPAGRTGNGRDDVTADDEDRPVVDGHANVERHKDDDWLLEQLPVSSSSMLWPSANVGIGDTQDDRILAQLKYVPR